MAWFVADGVTLGAGGAFSKATIAGGKWVISGGKGLFARGVSAAEQSVGKASNAVSNAGGKVAVSARGRDTSSILTSAERYLKNGYNEIAPGVFRSVDGERQFRMTNSDLMGKHGKIGPHVHFEKLDSQTREVLKNIHVPFFD
jgi:hypothetical protein